MSSKAPYGTSGAPTKKVMSELEAAAAKDLSARIDKTLSAHIDKTLLESMFAETPQKLGEVLALWVTGQILGRS